MGTVEAAVALLLIKNQMRQLKTTPKSLQVRNMLQQKLNLLNKAAIKMKNNEIIG
jgi:hypothetical protein